MLPDDCAARLNEWCNANCVHSAKHGPLVAAYDASEVGSQRSWRCYAPSTLDASGRYVTGNVYCTRHVQLSMLRESCMSELAAAAATTPPQPSTPLASATPLHRCIVSPLGTDATGASTDAACAANGADIELARWPASGSVMTVSTIDSHAWEAAPDAELKRLLAWEIPCVDTYQAHSLRNYTGNVSRRKAFLRRAGLSCHGRCVRGVVDGFATHDEITRLSAVAPVPQPGVPTAIASWRWDVPAEPTVFRTLVARAQAVLAERFGVRRLRFYRSNIITWDAPDSGPTAAPPWQPSSLHGDTNTDEMFLFTTILYLSQHGVDVWGGETGIADAVDGRTHAVTAGLRVEPSIGRLLVFSAGVENMHEMLPVRRGRRVACQMWFACDDLQPGWARPQRIAWQQEHGYGGPDRNEHAYAAAAVAPPLSAPLSDALAKPWPWRSG